MTESSVEQARHAHVSGRIELAERSYLSVLNADPGDKAALYGLSLVYLQTHRPEEAVSILRPLAVEPGANADVHCNCGIGLSLLDRHSEAVSELRIASRKNDRNPDIWFNLGNALQNSGRHNEAVEAYESAAKLDTNNAEILFNLANCNRELQRFEVAVRHYRHALQILPKYRKCLKNLALTLGRLGRHFESEECLRALIGISNDRETNRLLALSLMEQREFRKAEAILRPNCQIPSDSYEQYLLAVCLAEMKEVDEAIEVFRSADPPSEECIPFAFALRESFSKSRRHLEAVELAQIVVDAFPSHGDAYSNLGMAHFGSLDYPQAIANYEKARCHGVSSADIFNNLGAAHQALGNVETAISFFDHALRFQPDFAPARLNRAFSWFQVGKFREAWHEMEWRRLSNPRELPSSIRPIWDGSVMPDGVVVLVTEQGVGDIFQFMRYVREVRRRCRRVVMLCPSKLHAILSSCPGIDELIDDRDKIPDHDASAPLMSLPSILGREQPEFASKDPYIFASQELVNSWGQVLPFSDEFRVGIAWQGNPEYVSDGVRSVPLELFESLSNIDGVKLISLQVGFGAEQIENVADRFCVHKIEEPIDSKNGAFMDTAAIMSNLDLIVTSDTAIPHLAGAMGLPVWMATSFSPDWRWFGKGPSCPWYPTMRLFRQQCYGEWESCFESIANELVALAGRRRHFGR